MEQRQFGALEQQLCVGATAVVGAIAVWCVGATAVLEQQQCGALGQRTLLWNNGLLWCIGATAGARWNNGLFCLSRGG
jgi:hypothetical protein